MGYIGWTILLICLLTGGTVFFSVNTIALRIFSRAKLHDELKSTNKENITDALAENAEKLTLTCSLYRVVFNVCILLLLLTVFH